MTKYKSASFSLHLAAIFSHLSFPILKTSYHFPRNSIFEGVQRVAKAMTEVRKLGSHSNVASVPFVFQLETQTVSH